MTARHLALRDDRGRLEVRGPQATAVLNGLLTNDVATLADGAGQWAAALTAKGRVLALLRLVHDGDRYLVETDAAALPGLLAMLRKYVNPRLATVTDLTATTRTLSVVGPEAAPALASSVGVPIETLTALAPLGACRGSVAGTPVLVVRTPGGTAPGFEVVGPTESIDALTAALTATGWTPATAAALEANRIGAGVPTWGVDMTEETIAQEAALDTLGAIAFAKGCYTGQEVVARIHFRGHVNRLLRRLRADTTLLVGASVRDAAGAEVGDVRSAVLTDAGAIAIAMVRREVSPGAIVDVVHGDVITPARVEALHGGGDAAGADPTG